jgi:hypothetical protein
MKMFKRTRVNEWTINRIGKRGSSTCVCGIIHDSLILVVCKHTKIFFILWRILIISSLTLALDARINTEKSSLFD